jgi:hypothetical protein
VTAKSDEQTVRDTEARLNDAGFTKVTVDTPSESLQNLPTYKLNQFKSESGTDIWYYDPDFCQCLYEGNQAAANRYAQVLQQEKDLAQYQSDYENGESATQQALMASAYNGAVPLPFFWGGWASWYGYGVGYPVGAHVIADGRGSPPGTGGGRHALGFGGGHLGGGFGGGHFVGSHR